MGGTGGGKWWNPSTLRLLFFLFYFFLYKNVVLNEFELAVKWSEL